MKLAKIPALAILFLSATVAYAHHSFAMFDMSKTLTFQGTVVEYRWENPHTHIVVKVPETAGKETAGTWDVEGGAVNIMVKQGWSKNTYKAGDPITVVGHPMKDGSKAASLFYAILPDGRRLLHDVTRPNADGSVASPQP